MLQTTKRHEQRCPHTSSQVCTCAVHLFRLVLKCFVSFCFFFLFPWLSASLIVSLPYLAYQSTLTLCLVTAKERLRGYPPTITTANTDGRMTTSAGGCLQRVPLEERRSA